MVLKLCCTLEQLKELIQTPTPRMPPRQALVSFHGPSWFQKMYQYLRTIWEGFFQNILYISLKYVVWTVISWNQFRFSEDNYSFLHLTVPEGVLPDIHPLLIRQDNVRRRHNTHSSGVIFSSVIVALCFSPGKPEQL